MNVSEEAEQRKLLSDVAMVSKIERSLLSTNEREFSKQGQRNRFEKLAFLQKALRWKDNSAREDVIKTFERIIEADNLESIAEKDIKRSIVGDKVELFASLSESAPERAEQLYQRHRNDRLSKILDYSKEHFVFEP